MDNDNIMEHKTTKHLIEVVITPEHAKRRESPEFRKNKEGLKEDGHFQCFICGTTENLEVHHFGCEWSLEEDCDFQKLKEFCELFDPYGYGNLLKNDDIESVDDIRNLMVLCEKHHIHPQEGVHEITFPIWIIQKLAKSGEEPVPQHK